MIVEMILYQHVQNACSGKFWSSSYCLKHSCPIISLDYLLGSKNLSDFLFDVKPLYPNCMFKKTLVLKSHFT